MLYDFKFNSVLWRYKENETFNIEEETVSIDGIVNDGYKGSYGICDKAKHTLLSLFSSWFSLWSFTTCAVSSSCTSYSNLFANS